MHRLGIYLLVVVVIFSSAASAKTIVNEVQYYRQIEVLFSKNASVCGLKDEKPIVEKIRQRLLALDIPHNPDGDRRRREKTTATAGGMLKQRCIGHAEIQLQTMMSTEFIDASVYNSDIVWAMLSKRAYIFPIVFFQTGSVYGDLAPSMPERTLEILDGLMDDMVKARKLR